MLNVSEPAMMKKQKYWTSNLASELEAGSPPWTEAAKMWLCTEAVRRRIFMWSHRDFTSFAQQP